MSMNMTTSEAERLLISSLQEDREEIDRVLEQGKTLLMWACANGRKDIVKRIIDAAECFINARSECGGHTAISEACFNNDTEIVKMLIDAGADVNSQDTLGFTPLIFLASNGNVEGVKMLIDAGADVNAKGESGGHTALYYAVKCNNIEVVKILVANGADVNFKDSGDVDCTLLHYAAEGECPEIVECLVNAGADVNAKDICGMTALMKASYQGNIKIVKYLVDNGADIDGCLTIAQDSGHTDIVDFLESARR